MKKLALFSILIFVFGASAVFACGGGGCDKPAPDADVMCGGGGCDKPAPDADVMCGGGGCDKDKEAEA